MELGSYHNSDHPVPFRIPFSRHTSTVNENGRMDRTSMSPSLVWIDDLQPQHRRSVLRSLRSWKKEIASFFMAILALIAIVVILITSDNKPIQARSGPFTTNALVSIFAAILKSAMLMPVAEALSELKWIWYRKSHPVSDAQSFDLASRGPRGAFEFLFKLPGNRLACIGAAVIILALGIDPFTQQVIQNTGCSWPTNGTAILNRSNNYTVNDFPWANLGDGKWGRDETTVADLPMMNALRIAALNSTSDASTSTFYDCPSGNCTFDSGQLPYSSLAICTSVEKITNITGNIERWSISSGLWANADVWGIPLMIGSTNRSESSEDAPFFEIESIMMVTNCSRAQCASNFSQSDLIPLAFRASWHPCIKISSLKIAAGTSLLQH